MLPDLPLHEARERAEVPADFDAAFYASALWQAPVRAEA